MTLCVTRSSSSRCTFAMKISLSTTQIRHAQCTQQEKYLNSLFGVKKKSSNSNCHRLFVNKCACRNSDLKCKKKTACTPNRFDNCTRKIKSHLNSARLYLKNMYGSITSGSRRSCVHKFNWQCAFNSYIEQTCHWKVLLHNNWKAVCLLKRGHKIFQSCMQSWKVGKQACCKWCHAFQLLCWYYMVVLNVSCQHGKKKTRANTWNIFLQCSSSKVACFNVQGSKLAFFARGR